MVAIFGRALSCIRMKLSPITPAKGLTVGSRISSQYRDQTWFFMHYHSPGPVGSIENRGRRRMLMRMLMHWMLMHVNALKPMFDRYYCIKTENICYISRYFLHYFVSPFHRCLANVISTDYARSRAGHYTSRNGSKSVAPVRSYWKLRSRALTARELPC